MEVPSTSLHLIRFRVVEFQRRQMPDALFDDQSKKRQRLKDARTELLNELSTTMSNSIGMFLSGRFRMSQM